MAPLKPGSQAAMILDHLKAGRSITPLEALKLYGCLTLSQRCGQLRRRGWGIQSTMVAVGQKRVASYQLPKGAARGH